MRDPVKVLLVTHYFPPEAGAPQARLSELAACWAAAGAEVTVLTGMPNHPTGIIPVAYRDAVRRREERDGYRIIRTWLYATPNEGIARKTAGHLSFMVSAVLLGNRITGRAEVVVVSSPTFFSIGAAWLLAKRKRAKLVVEVRDLWPAIFVDLGVLTNKRAIALLERLELAAYRAADAVVTVTEGFRQDIVRRGIPPEKVHVLPNGVDPRRFSPDHQPDHAVRSRLGAQDGETLAMYAGAHGISQGLSSVVAAAAELRDDPVHIALVGEGADKRRVAEKVLSLGLHNVTMLPAVAPDEMPALLAAADLCLVPLRDVPLFTTFVPSKIFELLAAGRPVVGSVAGEAAAILTDAGAAVVRPEHPTELADAIRRLAADPAARRTMATRGRAYVKEHFDRRSIARRYLDLLTEVVRGPDPYPAEPTATTPRERSA